MKLTRDLICGLGLDELCEMHSVSLEDAWFEDSTFDVITCISVLEHIFDESVALSAIWRLLRPGGLLIISLPCAAEFAEEFRDVDSYGLQNPSDGWFFFQRFYDATALQQRIFKLFGQPNDISVYGERRAGLYRADLLRKLSDPAYPYWREPVTVGRDWKRYERIDELPGEGVVALSFIKDL
jgi:SAM-dependent methyltransferase